MRRGKTWSASISTGSEDKAARLRGDRTVRDRRRLPDIGSLPVDVPLRYESRACRLLPPERVAQKGRGGT